MARSVAIIGAGQIGYAAARAFQSEGWAVRVLARSKPVWLFDGIVFEHHILGEHRAPSADVVLDTIAFDEADAARFDPAAIGRYIAISSASVYCDDQGRGFETPDLGFPEFDGPIAEDQRRLPPGADTYSGRKVRMEDKALALFGERATILRPCAIYGPYSRQPREWWFVKRFLDGRTRVPIAFGANSVFHTTCVEAMAGLIVDAAERNLAGAFNIADDYALSVGEIGQAIAQEMDAEYEIVPFDGPPQGALGRTPWSLPKPFEISCRKAFDNGWDGFTVYPGVNNDIVWWLRDLNPVDWGAAFPVLANYGYDLFDYDAEDRFFASL
ncbi:MAG: hypothetical protein AAFW59_08295 [Pseudomonadota bacterium]